MNFFKNVTTLEELKKQYRKLALKHHPDKGGNEKEFIQMKAEYDKLAAQLNKGEKTETFQKMNDTFKNIIDQLINFDIDLEIIGSWVWVSGQTYAIKALLKELGFKFAGKKKAWYWHEEGYTKNHKKTFTLDEIREMHFSEKIKTSSRKAALGN